jgi:hypothetical protein
LNPQANLADDLRAQMQTTLHQEPGVAALWLGLGSGMGLAAAGQTQVARRRLAWLAPQVLGDDAAPEGGRLVLPGEGEVVAVVRVDDEKVLLALGAPARLEDPGLASLHDLASRLRASIAAWESRLLAGPGTEEA